MINIQALYNWQISLHTHPFTCGSGNRTDSNHVDGEGVLSPTENGWSCPFCNYKQSYGELEEMISESAFKDSCSPYFTENK